MTNDSLDTLVDSLTLAEQIALLAGADFWHTVPIERVGIPSMRVTDGPAGARGTLFDGPASINVPCGTSLAATWDPSLVGEVAALLGRETRIKGARVLLAPTVNLHRTPIGGRNFECFSEDPYLTARVAVGYVNGVQSEGVASCIKHFVGNDTEFERNSIDSQIDERTLRELYLVPFEAAVREAHVGSIMTAYNRINGPFSADSELIATVLRGEWGFDGLMMSDWFGLHTTAEGINAGLDLEMPGPTLHRGRLLEEAVEHGEVDAATIRRRALTVLSFMNRIGAFEDGRPGEDAASPGADSERAIVRLAGAAGMVLLRNEAGSGAPVLPLDVSALKRVAVIGPNAAIGEIMGGGSAHVTPTSVRHPLEALTERLGEHGVDVVHAAGCDIHKLLPAFDPAVFSPLRCEYFSEPDDVDVADAAPERTDTRSSRILWTADPLRPSEPARFGARLRATFTPDVSGRWLFGISSVGNAALYIDGGQLLNNADIVDGGAFFGLGKGELTVGFDAVAGRSYAVEARLHRLSGGHFMTGLNLGARRPVIGDPLAEAITAAGGSELAIVIVGTNDEWESEGYDRDGIALPASQDALIEAVAKVCPHVVVVINAGSPVAMPWLEDVSAVLMAWFPGQEMGDSLADVLLGDVEPQGRLPVTFPKQLEDSPAFEHHPGRGGKAHYLERRLIGYRWYDTIGRDPLFAFGFGLGYGRIAIDAARADGPFSVEVDLTNTGDRDAVEVVQVYAHRVDRRADSAQDDPDQRLVGFAKVRLAVGQSLTQTIALDRRAYSTWDIDDHAWKSAAGSYELRVGRSSRDLAVRVSVEARS